MKSNQSIKSALMLTAAILLSTKASNAALYYHVSIDTSSLSSSPASTSAPFALDFQFNAGGTLNNNTANIHNFTFNGGATVGAATITGSATGDLSTTIAINDTSFSELYQQFTPGSSIEFDMFLSNNEDSTTPDSFSVSILNGNLENISTSGVGNSLIQFDVSPTATANLGAGTGDFSGVAAPTLSAIPEPSALALCALGSMGLIARRRRNA